MFVLNFMFFFELSISLFASSWSLLNLKALISAKDWSQLLRRLATLESKITELTSSSKANSGEKPLPKRTRSNSGTGEDWGSLVTSKKTKK
jgi:hypothetical protein